MSYSDEQIRFCLALPEKFAHFKLGQLLLHLTPTLQNQLSMQSHYRPWQALRVTGVWGSQILRQSAHEGGKVVSPTHRPPLPPGNIPGTHLCLTLIWPQGHSTAGMKNSNDTIGNRSRDLAVCSAVPQPLRHCMPPQNQLKLVYIN
jgi:hypothetical protein